MFLSRAEADALIAMNKRFRSRDTVVLGPGTDATRELLGSDDRELFLLDLWRGTLRLSKVKLQTRARKILVLVRLDVDGAPHTNPDGTKIGGTHLHVYREGYDSKWAYPVDPAEFPNLGDMAATFSDFCHRCHILAPPPFQGGLL